MTPYSGNLDGRVIQEYQFEFCNELAVMLGMTSYTSPLSTTIGYGWKTNTSNIDLDRNTVPMLWVFADFVHKIMFGRQMLPLLRMVAMQGESNTLEHGMFALQHYVPVIRDKIQHFGITIRQRCDLSAAPFKMNGRVIIVLHFKRIEN